MSFIFFIFGKSKGGIVVKGYSAKLDILDEHFEKCRPDADYSTFKEGKPHHIDIEIDNLPLEPGEELELQLNGEIFAKIKVKRNNEAEFDHWSDEDIYFPVINNGDELIVRYHGSEVLKGSFYTRG